MSDRIRLVVLGVSTVVILAIANLQIMGKEKVIREGTTILLRLAPVDPRSLMQGDYMALNYAISRDVGRAARQAEISDGVAIVELGDLNEATFVAIYDRQQLAANQAVIRFRKRGESVRLASDAYFFEEGQWQTHENARFGEIRVDDTGDAVLTGLRDNEGKPLGAALHSF